MVSCRANPGIGAGVCIFRLAEICNGRQLVEMDGRFAHDVRDGLANKVRAAVAFVSASASTASGMPGEFRFDASIRGASDQVAWG